MLQLAPFFIEGIKKQYGQYLEPKTKVGVIEISGIIYSSDGYHKILQNYFKDKEIKAILVKIECPGGAAGSAQAIFNEIQQLKKEYPKPIISLVENVCASGGYYVACATDQIITPGTAIIGSIGTSFPYLFKLKELCDYLKIHVESAKAGSYKDMTNPFVDATPQDRVLLQALLDDSYQQFTQDVAAARKLSIATLGTWADGKIFTGRQALELGLIDIVGSAHTAIALIKEKAFIEGEIEWIHKKAPSGIARLFGQEDEGSSESLASRIFQVCSQFLCMKLYL